MKNHEECQDSDGEALNQVQEPSRHEALSASPGLTATELAPTTDCSLMFLTFFYVGVLFFFFLIFPSSLYNKYTGILSHLLQKPFIPLLCDLQECDTSQGDISSLRGGCEISFLFQLYFPIEPTPLPGANFLATVFDHTLPSPPTDSSCVNSLPFKARVWYHLVQEASKVSKDTLTLKSLPPPTR